MKRKLNNILVTGGCGFIGSNFIRYILTKTNFKGRIINIDALTYAGNPFSLSDIAKEFKDRYVFEKVDIREYEKVAPLFREYDIDTVVHFAAESHVDRSILGPRAFIETNVIGTFNLLESARNFWKDRYDVLFHHISTDEVYGSLGETGFFFETTPYDPRSPYSSSKASSDHLVSSYYHTYNLPITISNCSNNYGPYQFPEKLIPLMIDKIITEQPLPVYGDGKNIRDWLHVFDHNSGVWAIVQNGKTGETYNIGGENEWENIKLVNVLCEKIAKKRSKDKDYYKKLITFVTDRPGHDRRYAINCNKLKNELGWKQQFNFDSGLEQTIDWYLKNVSWSEKIKSGAYKDWIHINYERR